MTTNTFAPAPGACAPASKKGKQSIRHVPIEQLVNHPANIRKGLTGIDEMALSIREHGIIQPLTATELPGTDQLILLAGHRRLAGATKVGLKTVPVIIRHEVTEVAEHILLMLVENTQRADINAMERAEAYGALRDANGMSVGEIAKRTGAKQSTVSFYLNLLLLPDEEKEEIRKGVRSVTRSVAQVRAARAAERTVAEKRPVGRPKGARTKSYFGDSHPLAAAARALCGHRGSPKVGGVACGHCWESAIRIDAARGEEATPMPAPDLRAVADENLVERILGGDWKTSCSPSDKTEVARRWHAAGKSMAELEKLTGWRPSRYFKTTEDADTTPEAQAMA